MTGASLCKNKEHQAFCDDTPTPCHHPSFPEVSGFVSWAATCGVHCCSRVDTRLGCLLCACSCTSQLVKSNKEPSKFVSQCAMSVCCHTINTTLFVTHCSISDVTKQCHQSSLMERNNDHCCCVPAWVPSFSAVLHGESARRHMCIDCSFGSFSFSSPPS